MTSYTIHVLVKDNYPQKDRLVQYLSTQDFRDWCLLEGPTSMDQAEQLLGTAVQADLPFVLVDASTLDTLSMDTTCLRRIYEGASLISRGLSSRSVQAPVRGIYGPLELKGLPHISVIESQIRSLTLTPYTITGNLAALNTKYVVLIFSYNYGERLARCLESVLRVKDNRDDISVLVYDDGSSDNSTQVSMDLLQQGGVPFCIVTNTKNAQKPHNLFVLTRLIPLNPESIILFMDGDDYFISEANVLGTLDEAYAIEGVWSTLGSFELCEDISQAGNMNEVLHAPRKFDTQAVWNFEEFWGWFHLKTYKYKLLSMIEQEFFLEEDNQSFIKIGEDNTTLPRASRLSPKIAYIHKAMYKYDTSRHTPLQTDRYRYNYIMNLFLNKKYVFDNPVEHLPRELPLWRHNLGGYATFSNQASTLPPILPYLPKKSFGLRTTNESYAKNVVHILKRHH